MVKPYALKSGVFFSPLFFKKKKKLRLDNAELLGTIEFHCPKE